MTLEEIDKEFDLLVEYMSVYIQLLPELGKKIRKPQMPTFEYFKLTYNDDRYSLSIPHYKESKVIYDNNRIGVSYSHGLGSTNGIGYRLYNIWMGCKYFVDFNIDGDYTINHTEVNKVLKKIN